MAKNTSKQTGTGSRSAAGQQTTSKQRAPGHTTSERRASSAPTSKGRSQEEPEPRGAIPQGKAARNGRSGAKSASAKSATGPALPEAVVDFLCCGLETEQGGILVYNAAIECARDEELAAEWERYLGETEEHVQLYTEILQDLGIDPDLPTPGRPVCKNTADALIENMQMAQKTGDAQAAQIVAAECVVIAESKCHLNWELVGELAKKMKSDQGQRLKAAYEKVHEQENEHLYHTQGWARELWIGRLGMPAVIPPPEEEKDVKTRIGAEKAKNARKQML